MIAAFETRHGKIRSQIAELQIDPEETLVASRHEPSRNFEKGDEDDETNTCLTPTLSQGNLASHSKLSRTSSDGIVTNLHGTRRRSLSQLSSPSMETLPKLPLRRLSSDISGADRHFVQRQDALTRMYPTRQMYNQEGVIGTVLNTAQQLVRKKSYPQEKASSLYSPQAQGHHLLARRRSAPYSASRPRRPSSSSTVEAPKWRIKKHQRCLNIDDDDSDLEESMSRKSSGSSGFWSQSSFESI